VNVETGVYPPAAPFFETVCTDLKLVSVEGDLGSRFHLLRVPCI
jgi:hypothetical protein